MLISYLKFVNAGFSRIADILNEEIDSTDTESLASIPAKVGHFLKLLSMITRPFRFEQPALPSLEETVQEKFFPNFYEKLSAIELALQKLSEEREGKHLAQTNLTEPVMFLARLLQFDLGFPGAWTRSLKEKADSLVNVILQLAVLHGGGLVLEQVAFPLLLDTVFYIFDGEHVQQIWSSVANCLTRISRRFPVSIGPVLSLPRHRSFLLSSMHAKSVL